MMWNTPKIDFTPANGLTDQHMNEIGEDLNYLRGINSTDVTEGYSFKSSVDTRSWTATTWDLDDNPTHIDITSGATTVATLDLVWVDNKLTSAVLVCNGKTITYTVTWNDTKFVSRTKVVS